MSFEQTVTDVDNVLRLSGGHVRRRAVDPLARSQNSLKGSEFRAAPSNLTAQRAGERAIVRDGGPEGGATRAHPAIAIGHACGIFGEHSRPTEE